MFNGRRIEPRQHLSCMVTSFVTMFSEIFEEVNWHKLGASEEGRPGYKQNIICALCIIYSLYSKHKAVLYIVHCTEMPCTLYIVHSCDILFVNPKFMLNSELPHSRPILGSRSFKKVKLCFLRVLYFLLFFYEAVKIKTYSGGGGGIKPRSNVKVKKG